MSTSPPISITLDLLSSIHSKFSHSLNNLLAANHSLIELLQDSSPDPSNISLLATNNSKIILLSKSYHALFTPPTSPIIDSPHDSFLPLQNLLPFLLKSSLSFQFSIDPLPINFHPSLLRFLILHTLISLEKSITPASSIVIAASPSSISIHAHLSSPPPSNLPPQFSISSQNSLITLSLPLTPL